MRAPLPSDIARLEPLLRTLPALTATAEIMRHEPEFAAAEAALHREDDTSRQEYLRQIERMLPASGLGRVFALSFLVSASQQTHHLEALHDTIAQDGFTLEQRHFFYWQLLIRHAHLANGGGVNVASVYASLLESCRNALQIRAAWIPPDDRDRDSIVVITNQLLGVLHAPTADCLDYCYLLQTRLKKKVLLINTADMPWTLQLPYYRPVRFNYVEEYSRVTRLQVRDQSIEFYQCRKSMPNLEEVARIVRMVLGRKPSFVFSLGHSNVTPDLCADFVSVATMPFGTNLPQASSNVYVLPRRRRLDDADFMRRWRIAEEQIVEAEYTFRLPERVASLTRADLALPPDAYVIAIVGNRLDEEITDGVAAGLSRLLAEVPHAFLAFMGTFAAYGRVTEQHPIIAARSAFLGHQKDVLAVYEHCDAYFNPPRYGGGSSAAFALAMGLPVLTLATGDVANIAGDCFVFASFDEIERFVARAARDRDHGERSAGLARARFDEISDREGMLRTIVEGVAARAGLRRPTA